MSEYKIRVHRSRWQVRVIKGFLGFCLLSIWLWPMLFQWQWLIQLVLSLPVVVLYQSQTLVQPEHQFSLNEIGEVQWWIGDVSQPFKLSPKSVTSDWFCYLLLIPNEIMGATKKQRLWVFRDAVDEIAFRRLSRTIHRLRRS